GASAANGSGEQMLAFSTANRLPRGGGGPIDVRALLDGADAAPWTISALFAATVEATEEAVVNALLAAESTTGRHGNTLYAMPVDRVLEALERAGRRFSR